MKPKLGLHLKLLLESFVVRMLSVTSADGSRMRKNPAVAGTVFGDACFPVRAEAGKNACTRLTLPAALT